MIAGDPPGAQRQEYGKHHGELLGQRRHRQRDPGQQAAQPVAAGGAVEHCHQRAQGQADDRQDAHQVARLLLQQRLLGLYRLERLADSAHLCVNSRGNDAGDATALHRQRAGVDEGPIVTPRLLHLRLTLTGALAHRNRFAGQQRLIHRQVDAGRKDGVGRNAVALLDRERVAPDYLAAGDALDHAVTDDPGAGAGKVPQRLQGVLGLAFLIKGDAHDHADKQQQQQGLLEIAQEEIKNARRDQQDEHGLAHDVEGDVQNPAPRGRGNLVVTLRGQPLGSFLLGNARYRSYVCSYVLCSHR